MVIPNSKTCFIWSELDQWQTTKIFQKSNKSAVLKEKSFNAALWPKITAFLPRPDCFYLMGGYDN